MLYTVTHKLEYNWTCKQLTCIRHSLLIVSTVIPTFQVRAMRVPGFSAQHCSQPLPNKYFFFLVFFSVESNFMLYVLQ